ncbi:MAG: hypothetical protein FVQ80_15665 [Planctomycetes bacterium]|nr:hypothetical protein [Planctomycetota bacterium]
MNNKKLNMIQRCLYSSMLQFLYTAAKNLIWQGKHSVKASLAGTESLMQNLSQAAFLAVCEVHVIMLTTSIFVNTEMAKNGQEMV